MYPFWNLSYVLVLPSPFCFQTRQLPRAELNLFKETQVYTQKLKYMADVFDDAIEFIMEDVQNNICEVIFDRLAFLSFRLPFTLRCHKVTSDEPLDAFVSGTFNLLTFNLSLPRLLSDTLVLFDRATRTMERDFISHIFSKTFFKRSNHVL